MPRGVFDKEELRRRASNGGKKGGPKGGKVAGLKVALAGEVLCPVCGEVLDRDARELLGLDNHLDKIGRQGGQATFQRYGSAHMAEIGQKGGRGNRKEKHEYTT